MRSVNDVAERLVERGRAGRKCVLLPDTAMFVGLNLREAMKRPTRNDLIRFLCSGRCAEGNCHPCLEKANAIDKAYREGGPLR